MNDSQKVRDELRELGFQTELARFPNAGEDGAVVIDYPVETGRYKGQTFKIGIGFQESGYPEYPPHFIHVRELPESHIPHHSQHSYEGVDWTVFSIPPKDFWDSLPTPAKNMKTYINRHLVRFWSQI